MPAGNAVTLVRRSETKSTFLVPAAGSKVVALMDDSAMPVWPECGNPLEFEHAASDANDLRSETKSTFLVPAAGSKVVALMDDSAMPVWPECGNPLEFEHAASDANKL